MVTVTPNGDVPQQPGNWDNSYVPDQLIAGVYPRVTADVTVTSGATVNTLTVLPRGTVMGQQTIGAATAAAHAGNTGNGTISAVTIQSTTAKSGVYNVRFTAATTFSVFDPYGHEELNGVTGAAYVGDLGFTITAGGTPFAAGDSFQITVAAGTGNFIPSIATAKDGSQVPSGILVDDCNPSAGAVNAGIYQTGEFNQNAITFDTSWTVATLLQPLRVQSIFLKGAISYLPPTNE